MTQFALMKASGLRNAFGPLAESRSVARCAQDCSSVSATELEWHQIPERCSQAISPAASLKVDGQSRWTQDRGREELQQSRPRRIAIVVLVTQLERQCVNCGCSVRILAENVEKPGGRVWSGEKSVNMERLQMCTEPNDVRSSRGALWSLV